MTLALFSAMLYCLSYRNTKGNLIKKDFLMAHICMQLICAVCGIHKLTIAHCDYYHANKNKCFLNQIYDAHYISL